MTASPSLVAGQMILLPNLSKCENCKTCRARCTDEAYIGDFSKSL